MVSVQGQPSTGVVKGTGVLPALGNLLPGRWKREFPKPARVRPLGGVPRTSDGSRKGGRMEQGTSLLGAWPGASHGTAAADVHSLHAPAHLQALG